MDNGCITYNTRFLEEGEIDREFLRFYPKTNDFCTIKQRVLPSFKAQLCGSCRY